jgi:hypothetical protein
LHQEVENTAFWNFLLFNINVMGRAFGCNHYCNNWRKTPAGGVRAAVNRDSLPC